MSDSYEHIAIGCDHAGFSVKEYIKQKLESTGYIFHDFGTFSEASMDYPDTAHPLSKAVQSGQHRYGILLCGSGNGVAIVANRYKGVRAAVCWNKEIAGLARRHNDANIIVLPGRFISPEDAVQCVLVFLTTVFEGGRHQRRVDKISDIL